MARAEDATEAGPAAEEPRRGFVAELPGLLLALALALSIRACVVESFLVPSDSMFPTLLIGDHVFVTKYSYGARVPFTSSHLPALREPERGEVIVFQLGREAGHPLGLYPRDVRPGLPSEAFIKRLVGLPGDVVEVRGGELRINGEPVPRRRTGHAFTDDTGRRFDVWIEDLAGCSHFVLDDPDHAGLDVAARRVEADRYFFLGDNRDNSYDSRGWGTVHRGDLLGPAGLLYFSWDWTGGWLELLNPLLWWENLTGKTRFDRVGRFEACQVDEPPPSRSSTSDTSDSTKSGAGPS
jgi:signal peptidase I